VPPLGPSSSAVSRARAWHGSAGAHSGGARGLLLCITHGTSLRRREKLKFRKKKKKERKTKKEIGERRKKKRKKKKKKKCDVDEDPLAITNFSNLPGHPPPAD